MNRNRIGVIVLGIVLLAVPFWIPLVGGYTDLASRVLIYALAAMGLNLLLGFTGGLSFGHAAYFGLGAYGTGLMLDNYTNSTLLALLVGTATGGLAALVLGPLAVRRRGIYFSMITIAIGQAFYFSRRAVEFLYRRRGRAHRIFPPADLRLAARLHPFLLFGADLFRHRHVHTLGDFEFAAWSHFRGHSRKPEAPGVSRHSRGALYRALLRHLGRYLRAGGKPERAAG